jgi:hypothetical protein
MLGKKQKRDELPEGTYAETLAVYQIEHGWNSMDMTVEQNARFRLVEAARGDAANAKRLVFARLRYRSGALSDRRGGTER